MQSPTAALWFKKIALFTAVLALCVVVLGAYVRLSDAGLGCPDWPGCYGYLTVPQSEAAIAQAQVAYPDSPLEAHKAWKEMLHRYVAGTLGLLILAMCVLGWTARQQIRVSPWTPSALLLLVIFQAALGMWTVTLLLKPAVVTAHLLGGMATLALLTWIAHRHWSTNTGNIIPDGQLRFWIRAALIVLFVQIFLGGWTSSNYAALACTDFPTCHGAWIPEMDFANAFHLFRELGQATDGENLKLPAYNAIQWLHRVGALITFIYLGLLALKMLSYAQTRAVSITLLLALLIQIGLGIANLLLHLPLVLAVAHNLGAAVLVIAVVVLNSKITESRIGDR
jgi:cytochrome c oxidase assembly protein subunit 15